MVPILIQNAQELQSAIKLVSELTSLFWIVEYSPTELGYQTATSEYNSDINRYTFLRTECLKNPSNYQTRLDNNQYRIWTTTPQNHTW